MDLIRDNDMVTKLESSWHISQDLHEFVVIFLNAYILQSCLHRSDKEGNIMCFIVLLTCYPSCVLFPRLSSLVGNIHGIPFTRLFAVLNSCRELHYRDVDLLTDISDYIASTVDIWNNKQVQR